MKKFRYSLLVLAFLFCGLSLSHAQNKKSATKQAIPKVFEITNAEFDYLFTVKEKSIIQLKSNIFLDKSVVLINNLVGENKQLKLQLNYFKNAYLIVQINGKSSKIVFIISDDDSVAYNSVIESNGIKMSLCSKDDIISE